MVDKPVVFYDSGVGGLPYLAWVRGRLPGASFVYVADTVNFPLGEKPIEEVKRRVVETIERIIGLFDPVLIVIACNTASVTTLSTLRSKFPVPFVGVVPAIKPAATNSVYRRIGLLATSRTVADLYTENLIEMFAAGCTVVRQAEGHLVEFVECRYLHSSLDERMRIITPLAKHFKEERVDSVVLGCTHFLFLKEELARALGPEIRIIDSVEGVGRQTIRLLRDWYTESRTRYCRRAGKQPDHTATISIGRFFHTGPICEDRNDLNAFAERFGLEYAGIPAGSAAPILRRERLRRHHT